MTNLLDPEPKKVKPTGVKPPFKIKKKMGRFHNESVLEQQSRDEELNNMNRGKVTEDFSDSKFADRV